MRKYRNGKKSRRLVGDTKYSEEYLAYSHARGSKSVKASIYDTDGNGDVDTIFKAWRHPAVRKSNNPTPFLYYPPLGADNAPTGISTVQSPSSAPTSLSVLASPQVAPTGVSSSIELTEGPTGISAVASPQVAPTAITLNLDQDEDGVYADADLDDNDPTVGTVVPPTSPPSNIGITTSPQVAPTNISVTEQSGIMLMNVTYTFDAILSTQFTLSGGNTFYYTFRNTALGYDIIADTANGAFNMYLVPTAGGTQILIQDNNTYALTPSWTTGYFNLDPDPYMTLHRTNLDFSESSFISGLSSSVLGTDVDGNKTDGKNSYQVNDHTRWYGVFVIVASVESNGTYTVYE